MPILQPRSRGAYILSANHLWNRRQMDRWQAGVPPPSQTLPPLGFHLRQQLLDAVFLLQRGQPVFHVFGGDLRFGVAQRLRVHHLALHAIEGVRLGAVAHGHARVRGFAHGPCPSVTRDQQIGLGLCLGELLLQTAQRRFQVLHLHFLIRKLLLETATELAVALDTLQRGARQIVLLLVDGEFGFAHPLRHFVLVFFSLFFQQVLVGDRDRHLRLDLQKLILHVEDYLLDHLFRFLGLVDQVVEVGPNQRRNSLQ